MNDKLTRAATIRAVELRRRLKRYKLVFVQRGANYSVLRDPLLAELSGSTQTAVDFATMRTGRAGLNSPVVLTGIEAFAETGDTAGITLGQLRQMVSEQLEAGAEVCLISTAPRIAFQPVPGSSLIEDASVFSLPPLGEEECECDLNEVPEGRIPSVGLGFGYDTNQLFRRSLAELGVGILATLDHAIFETTAGDSFLTQLQAREIEALRGAGFVEINGPGAQPTVAHRFNEFSKAVADVLAETVEPQHDLGAVSEGLWLIERTIRLRVRDLAISQYSGKWKRNVLHGDLPGKALGRARSDMYVTATKVSDLRDPIEWLTLGELLEVVRSDRFGRLGFDEIFWRRFEQDIVPIRNRLSHMRLVKKGDRDVVRMWASRFKNP